MCVWCAFIGSGVLLSSYFHRSLGSQDMDPPEDVADYQQRINSMGNRQGQGFRIKNWTFTRSVNVVHEAIITAEEDEDIRHGDAPYVDAESQDCYTILWQSLFIFEELTGMSPHDWPDACSNWLQHKYAGLHADDAKLCVEFLVLSDILDHPDYVHHLAKPE